MIGKWYGKTPRPSGKAGEYDDYDILMRCDIWWDYAPGVSAGREWPSYSLGFGFRRNSEVKRVARESTPMMGDPLGSSHVSSQKQNREGVVGAQSEQYRATVVELAWDVVDLGSGCDNFAPCLRLSIVTT